ncbi:AlbA family DNA-binding domain-containing protein [Cellvibrio fibrivorans]|uniref:Schlafen AlbA-2 domain-containing protein n=1 Tax=Cellvibrio fibrivorans TaxID=126350 RepID=A0ABU1UTY1_9GAMM|nr:hypothetical protein [Cellvibrio fibrivorans]MDR7088597.1 hypothetical protein [Cellvibrio fibrivorans]
MIASSDRLEDLLLEPREDLNCEIKNWLNLRESNEDKATLAKAILAIANHGGGFVILGLVEVDLGIIEADGRPASFNDYSQDLINGIVQNYSDPPFHCAVHFVANPAGALFPIIRIPGSHRVPIRARRSGPNGNTIQNHAIYIRKPGPRSESPQSAQEWDELLARCLLNRRDEMLAQIRDLLSGAVPQVETPESPDAFTKWIATNFDRWKALVETLPADVGPRMNHGYYSIAYEIIGERKLISPAQFPGLLQASVVRQTGWPPFLFPTRDGIKPYQIDGAVECWLGGDSQTPPQDRDAAHSDFWRIHPDGFGFLIRGFQEDDMEREQIKPATVFDVTLPVWRIGETLMQARHLACNLFNGPTSIRFSVTYEGLAGRSLVSINKNRSIWEGRVARQNAIVLPTHIDTQAIDSNLPEIIHPLLSPLYLLFDFFELPMQLVATELSKMKAGKF